MSGKNEFTLEDILKEERTRRETAPAAEKPVESPTIETEIPVQPEQPEPQALARPVERPVPDDAADLNAFATGNLPNLREAYDPYEEPEPEHGKKGKKKKKKRGLFGRKKVPDFDEGEDFYYGLQLKPIDEYSQGFDPVTGEFTLNPAGYDSLFDDSKKAIDDEVEENFQRLQRERRRRVAEAVQNAGVDAEEIASEFGVVAPMPITSFAADPYAKEHGIDVEGSGSEDLPDIQKAMLQSSQEQTMEVKLNVASDAMELQRAGEDPAPPVSEGAVQRILKSDEPTEAQPAPVVFEAPAEAVPVAENPALTEETPERPRQEEPAPEESAQEPPVSDTEIIPEEPAVVAPEIAPEEDTEKPAETFEDLDSGKEPTENRDEPVIEGRAQETIPQVGQVYEYRARSVPTHIINVDVVQSALLSESEELKRAAEEEEIRSAIRSKRSRKSRKPEFEDMDSGRDTEESIDDYTGPEDAKAIAGDLKGDMQALTLRLLITGVCTALLAIANLIFPGRMAAAGGDGGSSAVVYLVLTLLFLGVSVGICFRTVVGGLRALFSFNANSDSAAAVAAVAAVVQTVLALFFRDDLADGRFHLYAVVLSAILFVNAAGKLTMIRRIHSNFRFVSSKEQKYAVNVYDDYNTALKMTRDAVAERPQVAYQCRAGFLRRFLELSYAPDLSETASQQLAPIGLIASLAVCAVCLLITSSVPAAISALAASSCACVAVGNMLSVNLPVSRLCKTARRAGGMTVGYEAVEKLGNVNAVLVDAEEIFPRGTVVLGGIKTMGGRASAEEAILLASAVIQEAGGPLGGVFDQVISENEDALPLVDSVRYESEGGIVGRVDGKTVYIGTRALLINHRIDALTREEEIMLATGNRVVIYIAVDTEIAAILTLTYSADRHRKNELQRLENSGVSVIVRTTDPNVNSAMLARLFGVEPASVGVIDGELGDTAKELLDTNIPRADAVAATKGRAESLMSVVSACVELKRSLSLTVAIQTAAAILGLVLVAFLACFGAIRQLTALVLFLFQALALAVVLLLPKLRR